MGKKQTSGRKAPRAKKPLHERKRALAALLDYKKKYGHCRVPTTWPGDPALGAWVSYMRWRKHNRLSKDRIAELDRIGFVWSINVRPEWESYFKKLEAFKKKHGHCNVPKVYPQDPGFACWVHNMPARKRRKGLDRTTIRRLTELGFCWSVLHRRFHRRDLGEFVAIVAAFKKKHGNASLVKQDEVMDEDLRGWVHDVRKSKKHGRLDPKVVRQLERLGFVWDPRTQFSQEMRDALLAYRKRYGDCRVPRIWPEDPRLASWVSRMRTARRRNQLTQAEIRELTKLGFCWNATRGEKPPRKGTKATATVKRKAASR